MPSQEFLPRACCIQPIVWGERVPLAAVLAGRVSGQQGADLPDGTAWRGCGKPCCLQWPCSKPGTPPEHTQLITLCSNCTVTKQPGKMALWSGEPQRADFASGAQIQPDLAFSGSQEPLSSPEIATQMMLSAAGDDDAKILVIQQEQLDLWQLSLQLLRDAGTGRPAARSQCNPWVGEMRCPA